MKGNTNTKRWSATGLGTACLLVIGLAGCASGEAWNRGVAANPAGTRMGLPIPACEACASDRQPSHPERCDPSCLGACCKS